MLMQNLGNIDMEYICKNCKHKFDFNPEHEKYYKMDELIVDGKLVKCPYCIKEKIEIIDDYFTPRVIGTGPYDSNTYFAPHYSSRIIVIEPVERVE